MPSNKNRLYIALYPSGVVNNEERKYHWAFLIGPKEERAEMVPGMRIHVKNGISGWTYHEEDLSNVKATTNLLARFVIAKIENEGCLVALLRQLPVVQNDPDWRCRTWVASALAEIANDGRCVGTRQLNWQHIEAFARRYVADKAANGRYQSAADLDRPRPTWNLFENLEHYP